MVSFEFLDSVEKMLGNLKIGWMGFYGNYCRRREDGSRKISSALGTRRSLKKL
jgi:hypothetical protein